MPWTPTPGEDQAGPGQAMAPYPGQISFVEKTAEEVLRVLTEDLWMTVQSHDQPVRGEESWMDPSKQQPLPGGG